MASTEAHKKAVRKYMDNHVERVVMQIYPTSGVTKAQIVHCAEQNGMSLNQWLLYAIKKAL